MYITRLGTAANDNLDKKMSRFN